MIESIRAAFSLPDLRRRILFTVFMLIIYRLVANIPVPGVNLTAWESLTDSSNTNAVIDFLNLLSGGAVRNFSVMAMGVYPYITASIIIQLLTPIIPQLEEMQSEGESGRNRLNKITYYLTVPLSILQAIGQIRLIGFSLVEGGGIEYLMPNFGFTLETLLPTLTTLLAMVGGTMFAIWIGEQITESGIGQGISLIIFGGIVAEILPNLSRLFSGETFEQVYTVGSFIILTVVTVFFIVYVQQGERRIPVQYGRRVRGRKVYQGQSTYVPLKVNTAGMIPIIFAQAILTFPPLVANFFVSDAAGGADAGILNTIALSVSQFGSVQDPRVAPINFALYWIVYFLLVFGFTFFYTDVMVQQQNIPQTLQRNGGFIPGIRPGKRTSDYVTAVVRRITLVGAVFLGLVSVLPGIMSLIGVIFSAENIEQSALVVNGAGLIIVVGVVIDTMRQLESQLLMRNYKGFNG